jgi:hypothetical protein
MVKILLHLLGFLENRELKLWLTDVHVIRQNSKAHFRRLVRVVILWRACSEDQNPEILTGL